MSFSPDELEAFWSAAWSVPLRSACRWLEPAVQTHLDAAVQSPLWLKPFCVQRWIGQAVLDRLAWMRAHPEAAAYRFSGPAGVGDASLARWTEPPSEVEAWLDVHLEIDDCLCWRWEVEVERLLRISEAPPALLGEALWAQAVLRSCARLSLVYAELKRAIKPCLRGPCCALVCAPMSPGIFAWQRRDNLRTHSQNHGLIVGLRPPVQRAPALR